MVDVPVFFASTEGQTRRIAERLASWLTERGADSRAIDIESSDAAPLDWSEVRGVLIGASLHAGKHQAAAGRFAREHHEALNARPSAFFSVSLSAASQRESEREAARALARAFPEAAGWRPTRIVSFAGAVAYRKYGFLKRLMMRWISAKEGGPTDMSRDHELTNWDEVRELALYMADRIRRVPAT